MNYKSLFVLITAFLLNPAFAETLYTSDQLKTDLRSGASNQHRIIKFLSSGTKLEVLDTSEDGSYKLVRSEDGKQGWVNLSNLMAEPAARDRVPALNKRIDSLRKQLKQKQSEINELNGSLRDANNKNEKLDSFGQDKEKELAELKKIAARPAQLAKQNMELKAELDTTKNSLEVALAENQRLKDSSGQEWFMIGATVALFSLFLGLIIPNFRWRRKKDNWGGGF